MSAMHPVHLVAVASRGRALRGAIAVGVAAVTRHPAFAFRRGESAPDLTPERRACAVKAFVAGLPDTDPR